MRMLLIAAAATVCLLKPATAGYDPHGFTTSPEVRHVVKRTKVARVHRKHRVAHHRRQSHADVGGGIPMSGIVSPLAAKTREIVNACGSRVISAVRHTRVAGSGHMSLHASGRAVDIAGNPSCIYAHLHGWPGGYSIDYGRVKHVHVSYGGREMGLRFAHNSGRRAKRTRYAHLR